MNYGDEGMLDDVADFVTFLGPVLEQLDRDGEHSSAQSLRDQCELLVRNVLQDAAE